MKKRDWLTQRPPLPLRLLPHRTAQAGAAERHGAHDGAQTVEGTLAVALAELVGREVRGAEQEMAALLSLVHHLGEDQAPHAVAHGDAFRPDVVDVDQVTRLHLVGTVVHVERTVRRHDAPHRHVDHQRDHTPDEQRLAPPAVAHGHQAEAAVASQPTRHVLILGEPLRPGPDKMAQPLPEQPARMGHGQLDALGDRRHPGFGQQAERAAEIRRHHRSSCLNRSGELSSNTTPTTDGLRQRPGRRARSSPSARSL